MPGAHVAEFLLSLHHAALRRTARLSTGVQTLHRKHSRGPCSAACMLHVDDSTLRASRNP